MDRLDGWVREHGGWVALSAHAVRLDPPPAYYTASPGAGLVGGVDMQVTQFG